MIKKNNYIIIGLLIVIFVYLLFAYYGTINEYKIKTYNNLNLNKLPKNYTPTENNYDLIIIYNINYDNIKSILKEWLNIQKRYDTKIIKNKKINIYSANILEYNNIEIDKNNDSPSVFLVSKYIFFELNNSINQRNIEEFLNEKL